MFQIDFVQDSNGIYSVNNYGRDSEDDELARVMQI